MTNSLYKDREVFLRELVSNGSDALEKLRHAQNSGSEVREGSTPLEIRITVDPEGNTLTLEDTGVGMTRKPAGSATRGRPGALSRSGGNNARGARRP